MERWLWIALAACRPGTADRAPDADADADSDADSDSDTDADSDPGPDSTAPDTGIAGPVFDDAHVLVVPDAHGLGWYAADGSVVWSRTWPELVGPCDPCGGEGAAPDGDGLLVSFTTTDPVSVGGIARIDGAGTTFRVDGFQYPHAAVRDPADGSLIVAETTDNALTWIAGDGGSAAPIRRLAAGAPGWEGDLPNGLERLEYGGRTYLLVSHRGQVAVGVQLATGEITLWDITATTAPTLVWRFPEEGSLGRPHGAVLRRWRGKWWLAWAHTDGLQLTGSIGLAVTDDPTVAPAYVADLRPVDPVGTLTFVRGVELTGDGWLYVVDSGGSHLAGGGGTDTGRLIRAPAFDPGVSGRTGAIGDQVVLDLPGGEVLASGLANPFHGWLWSPTF